MTPIKSFLKQLVFFLLLLSIVILSLLTWLSHKNTQLLLKYKIDPNVNTLIIGDSHLAHGIDDHLLPNCLNISEPAEAFMFSYSKLLPLLKTHPQIRTVILGCSYHSISAYYDKRMFGELSIDVSSNYFFIVPNNLKFQFLWSNMRNGISYFREVLNKGGSNLSKRHGNYSFIGYYNNHATHSSINDSSITKRINYQYFTNGKLANFSSSNMLYLHKIIELCKNRGMRLIILNTPLHVKYKKAVPMKFKDKFYSLVDDNKIDLIEFDDLKLTDSCFLPDGDHLSQRGATLATLYLRELMKKYNF